VRRLRELARWIGAGRGLTQNGRIKLSDARALVTLLQTGDELDPKFHGHVHKTRSSDELYGLHLLVDIHWDYLAVSAPVFLVLGSLAGEPAPRRGGLLAPAAALLVAAAGVYSLASPYLASRKLDDAAGKLDRGEVAAAYDDSRSARSLNPLSVEPLFLEGYTAASFVEGEALLVKAVRLQPRNPDAWVQLGEYELDSGRYRRAYQALNRAYTLDRWNATAVKGRELDQARCRVDPTTCRGSGLPAPRAGRSS